MSSIDKVNNQYHDVDETEPVESEYYILISLVNKLIEIRKIDKFVNCHNIFIMYTYLKS